MNKMIVVIVALLFSFSLFAQPDGGGNVPLEKKRLGSMSGVITEAGSKHVMEYANVAVYSSADSSLAGGSIADENGQFAVTGLRPGNYYVDFKFIGYEHTKKENVTIGDGLLDLDLGTIELFLAAENLGEINVLAQEHPIMYQIDKKVIDSSQFPTSANGTAADVLANTPSVVVDVEGNVTLRGSSDFTVMIDGRPTPFDPADALDQIPASTIRNIEIITNPSAKYDPDGNGGIININTKKSKLVGISGILNATADSYGFLTGDFLMNYKLEKFNIFLSGNKSNRYSEGEYESFSESYDSDTITTVSVGESNKGRESWSLKSGFDFFMNDKNTLSFNVSLDGRSRTNGGIYDSHEYSTSGYDLISLTESSSDGSRKNVAFSLDYKKTFEKEGQEFTAYAYYETGTSSERSPYEQYDENSDLIEGQKSWEDGDGTEFRLNADYVYPINDKTKFEMGYQARIDRDYEWNDVHWYTVDDDYEPTPTSEYYSDTHFDRDIHSFYGIFNNAGTIMGYQLGLRTEYTNRVLDFSGSTQEYKINRWDLFPTAHFSFQLPLEQQLTVSYARRISRPRGYYLEPFITYVDAYNIRSGNPDIQPEYINSYEMGYQKQVGEGYLSMELYHRKTDQKIEKITSVYDENIMLQSVVNIGEDYSTGLEVMLNMRPTKWWMINLMGNVYDYRIEGEIDDESIDQQSSNWNSRFSNTFTLSKTTKLQFDGMYNSATTSAQGERDGFLFTNMALRQDFFDNKLNVTFSVRDVLNTAKFGFESSGDDFYSSRNYDMKSPVFSLTMSYKINNYRQKRGSNGESNEGGSMDMEGDDF
jgi:outer membrane receptor protein involved in Fe transport